MTDDEYRAKLEAELHDGLYSIGVDPYTALTGKGGYIEYMVALRQALGKGLIEQIEAAKSNKITYKRMTGSELAEALTNMFNRRNNGE